MRIKQYFSGISALLKAKLISKGTPLLINWAITSKCNSQCVYCKIAKQNTRELSTAQIIAIIKVLRKQKTLLINFTGGEPLIRADIIDILKYTAQQGIGTVLNTNGILLKQKKTVLDHVQTVKLSFDGPENVHDQIRGKGAFRKTIQAIDTIRGSKAKLLLCTVLCRNNLDSLDYILNKAKDLNSQVFFQPATRQIMASKEDNPLFPDIDDYKKAVACLRRLKYSKKWGEYIANSANALEYLYDWPDIEKIHCAAGLLFAHITADGYLMRCARNPGLCKMDKLKITDDFDKSFARLRNNQRIPCFCPGMLECNFLYALNLHTAVNLLKLKF